MKNYISRREFLKRISIGGSAVFVPLTFVRDRLDDTTFILYSNDAERDIRELTKAICRDFGLKAKFSGHKIDLDGSHRSYRAIFFQEIFSGVKPDLTIVQSDEVIDPSKSGMKNVRRFLHSLRKGKPSRYKIWISVKRRNILNILAGLEPNTNKVEIFANGKKVEEFDILKNDKVRESMIHRIVRNEHLEAYEPYLTKMDNKELARQLIEGGEMVKNNLTRFLDPDRFSLKPLHNFFFTRDASMTVNNKVLIAKMASKVRDRESLIMENIFPQGDFAGH